MMVLKGFRDFLVFSLDLGSENKKPCPENIGAGFFKL